MTLWVNSIYKYANPYDTNWDYLYNMAELQMIPLEKMNWYMDYIYIDLRAVPDEWQYRTGANASVESFIDDLNNVIMEL